jgi:hypothetical protein
MGSRKKQLKQHEKRYRESRAVNPFHVFAHNELNVAPVAFFGITGATRLLLPHCKSDRKDTSPHLFLPAADHQRAASWLAPVH